MALPTLFLTASAASQALTAGAYKKGCHVSHFIHFYIYCGHDQQCQDLSLQEAGHQASQADGQEQPLQDEALHLSKGDST